jgi:hypothetical protein
MFDSYSTQELGIYSGYGQSEADAQIADQAQKLYDQARSRNWLDKLWLALRGRSRRLLDLTVVQAAWTGLDHHSLGIRKVPIGRIRGSFNEGRCRDFDVDFRPLKTYNQTRWLGVATAWLRGVKLPPVSLIQVGEIYFLEDGHHRVSVARALGQMEIEAVVTVWQVVGPLPWQEPVSQPLPNKRTSLTPKQAKI